MKKKLFLLISTLILSMFASGSAMAHCEIPCGIYDDGLRVKLIYEHIGTIEKSMKQIENIRKKSPINYNQLIRWTNNKEKHADEIQHIVSQYFLTQRIHFKTQKYTEKLTVLHKIMVYAMKCKQSVNLDTAVFMKVMLRKFEELYF